MLRNVHLVVGIAVLATNLIAGGWGGVAWVRKAPSTVFWYLLRTAQGVVVLQVLLGLALVAIGKRPMTGLHFLYGLLPLLVTLVTEAMRVGAAQAEIARVEGDVEALGRREQAALARRVVLQETFIMALGALFIAALAIRAAATAGAV